MNMARYFLLRVAAFFLQIIGAVALIIAATSLISYDPTILFAINVNDDGSLGTETRSDEEIEQFRQEIGLDKSPFEQFFDYITAMFTEGDLGNSWLDGREPVTDLYLEAFSTTLRVFGLGILIFTILAVVLGVLAARRLDGRLDKNVRFTSSLFYAFPPFVLGTLLIFLTENFLLTGFEIRIREHLNQMGVNTNAGYTGELTQEFLSSFAQSAIYELLPVMTVVLIYTGFQFRLVRIYVSDVLNKNYIRTAHAKGLDEKTILIKHGLRNAIPELITSIAITFPVAISGVAVLEKVFEIEGSGLLLINAGLSFNWPILLGGAVIFVALNSFILGVSDLLINYIDPRLRLK